MWCAVGVSGRAGRMRVLGDVVVLRRSERVQAAERAAESAAATRGSEALGAAAELATPRQRAEGARAAKRASEQLASPRKPAKRRALQSKLFSEEVCLHTAQGLLPVEPPEELEFSWGDGVETRFNLKEARDFYEEDEWSNKPKCCKKTTRLHFLLNDRELDDAIAARTLTEPLTVQSRGRYPGHVYLYNVPEIRAVAQEKANKQVEDAARKLEETLEARQKKLTQYAINPAAIKNAELREWTFGKFSDARIPGPWPNPVSEVRRRFVVAMTVQRHFAPAIHGKVLARRVAADLVRFQGPGRLKNFKTELNALKGSGGLCALRRWLIKRLNRGIEVAKIFRGDVKDDNAMKPQALSTCLFTFLDEESRERLLKAAPGLYEAEEEGDGAEEEGDDAGEEDDGRL